MSRIKEFGKESQFIIYDRIFFSALCVKSRSQASYSLSRKRSMISCVTGVVDSMKYRQSWNHITGFNSAACFTFYLPNEMLYVDVTSAELWFYKEQVENDDETLNQTFVLSELDHWDLGGSFEKNTIMAIFETDIIGG